MEETRQRQMIKSMTGFGRYEASDDLRKVTVELKSVNHRYLDANIRIPKKLGYFESSVRALLKDYASRGKIDIFISYENLVEAQSSLRYNSSLAKEHLLYLNQISEELGVRNDVSATYIARCPEVLVMEENQEDEEEIWAILSATCKKAFAAFAESRGAEGVRLREDILGKLINMEKYILKVESRGPEILREYRGKLEDKVKELLNDTQIDEGRIATEIVLFSDKICTDEETVRLRSHILHMRETFGLKEGIGRKLDFIAQEMNREANTILSKANDMEVSNWAIELKTEVEKIREQIQNIE